MMADKYVLEVKELNKKFLDFPVFLTLIRVLFPKSRLEICAYFLKKQKFFLDHSFFFLLVLKTND